MASGNGITDGLFHSQLSPFLLCPFLLSLPPPLYSLQEAIKAYSDCLALDPTDDNPSFTSKLYANRAAALIKLSRNGEAFEDCSKCIELDGAYAKAYVRRAQAGLAMGDVEHLEGAVRDYTKAKE